ncbi:MAG TPA: 3-phosphoshikimate 1-carboxyvinyltransferase, partial [Longimicrobiales bacterium]|nr:3-phosphoshikimate 1-carboxyvinyltransferase [Longimicrobiales bacterium]
DGESRLRGLLPAGDPRSTAEILRRLGVEVPPLPKDGSDVRIRGAGLRGLREPDRVLDAGNSGTTARILLGVLAGQELEAVLDGDESLRRRPMARVTGPLAGMGARFEPLGPEGRLPLRIRGGDLGPLEYDLPVASAQVKSALLLAGLTGGAPVRLTEPGRSRDHTERMLAAAGVSLSLAESPGGGRAVELARIPGRIEPLDFQVPGDFSAAAYPLALALLGGAGSELTLRGVGLNPTRTGLLPVLERMGADVEVRVESGSQECEPIGEIRVRPSALRGTEVGSDEIPVLLDEVPILAILMARASGPSRITGAGEMRVKESDRLSALAGNLRAVGATVEELEDGLAIRGSEARLEGVGESRGDHRIAMAFGVLGASPGCRIEIEGRQVVEVSYPGFWAMLASLGESGG